MTLTKKIVVRRLEINSEVQCRFATTTITTEMENGSEGAQEVEFVANLPDAAMITYFDMEVDGKVTVGDVKEKDKAKKQYDAAKERGETAAHVAQAPRETNTFNISTNVAPYRTAKFKLVYQELLNRVMGAYKHQINVHPGQIVDDLKVTVHINESGPLRTVHVPKFAPKLSDKSVRQLLMEPKAADVKIVDGDESNEKIISWHPTKADQEQLLSTNGALDGQLIVLYDVDRKDDQVLAVDGHFIHFFAPKDLPTGAKTIVFALDISGSMSGTKLRQVKDAMRAILKQLRTDDHFNILCFDNDLITWKESPVKASEQNVGKAIEFVQSQRDRGSTNIDLAVQKGLDWLLDLKNDHLARMLVLLTDGQHNQGVNRSQIIPRITEKLRKKEAKDIKVYGLGFGSDADFDLLREMSAKTGAFARKIYEASDAAIQLENFYAEVSSPVLADLDIKYLNPDIEVSSIVRNISGNTLFDGAELVIIGRLKSMSISDNEKLFEWSGRGCKGNRRVTCVFRPFPIPVKRGNSKSEVSHLAGQFIERSWAYLTVKNLLERAKVDSSEASGLKKQALELALKYKFVTELTSMVVTEDKQLGMEDLEESNRGLPAYAMYAAAGYRASGRPPALRGGGGGFVGGDSQCDGGSYSSLTGGHHRLSSLRKKSKSREACISEVFDQDECDTAMSSGDEVSDDGFGSAMDQCAYDDSVAPAPIPQKGEQQQQQQHQERKEMRPAKLGSAKPKAPGAKKARNHATTIAALVGVEHAKLPEVIELYRPTLIEKIVDCSMEKVVGALQKMLYSSIGQPVDNDMVASVLKLLAALMASKLGGGGSPDVAHYLDDLKNKQKYQMYIDSTSDTDVVIRISSNDEQLWQFNSWLHALQSMVLAYQYLGVTTTENKLLDLLAQPIHGTGGAEMQSLANEICNAIDNNN